MKKNLLIILTYCLCLPLLAQTDTQVTDTLPWPQNLRARIDSVLTTPLLQTTQIGLMVYDLTADSALYTYGHRQRLRPASTMKLLTAITALDRLGEDCRLTTTLNYMGTIERGTLCGNISCTGGMDPLLDMSDMRYFVNQLRHQGIDTIRGRIFSNMSFKEDNAFGEGWCWDDDNPVLSPLLVEGKDNFAETLRRELRRDGVVIIDTVVSQSLRARNLKWRQVCSRSHTIGEVLVKMMKDSNNLFAESVFYQLAAREGGLPARAKQAVNAVKRMIQKVGLQPGDYRVADGSGLSLYNYVSAELEVQMLRYAYHHQGVFGQLYTVLPLAGVDGTLKSRMKKTAAEGNVRAKTGSVSGISSLAGYCRAANGHTLCFAIINQGVSSMSDGRQMQDRLCVAMCQ